MTGLTLHAWGADSPLIPRWQRLALRLLYPLLKLLTRRAFRIYPKHHARAVANVSSLLAEVEERLDDGRQSILGGDEVNYSDLAFASIMGLWLMPPNYGLRRADAVRITMDQCPAAMQREVETWKSSYPRSSAFIERLYQECR